MIIFLIIVGVSISMLMIRNIIKEIKAKYYICDKCGSTYKVYQNDKET